MPQELQLKSFLYKQQMKIGKSNLLIDMKNLKIHKKFKRKVNSKRLENLSVSKLSIGIAKILKTLRESFALKRNLNLNTTSWATYLSKEVKKSHKSKNTADFIDILSKNLNQPFKRFKKSINRAILKPSTNCHKCPGRMSFSNHIIHEQSFKNICRLKW